jgi:hypothetical protein
MKSTNFSIQALLLLVFAFLELVGFPIDVAEEIKVFVEATLLTGAGFFGIIRAWIAKGISFEYTSNIITYLVAFVSGVVGWFGVYAADVEGATTTLIDAISTGNFNMIFPALFTVGNIIYRIIQDRAWIEIDATA